MRLLVLGLAAKEAGEGTLVTDVLIGDGRVDAPSLGAALLDLLQPEPGTKRLKITVPRIVKRLTQASHGSKLHSLTVLAALDWLARETDVKAFRHLVADLRVECVGGDLTCEQLKVRMDRAERWLRQ